MTNHDQITDLPERVKPTSDQSKTANKIGGEIYVKVGRSPDQDRARAYSRRSEGIEGGMEEGERRGEGGSGLPVFFRRSGHERSGWMEMERARASSFSALGVCFVRARYKASLGSGVTVFLF